MLMAVIYDYLFPAMWLVYAAYWWAISKDVKESKRREPGVSRFVRMILLLCAVRCGSHCRRYAFLRMGRRHLGKNWSQAVTLKEDHELITSGPYALVRHPIYTGLLLAIVGCALARGEWRGLLAVALAFVALWQKLKLEEKWMRAQFGESYEAYSRRVAALVPHIL
jgi:protein-S-isoprenylcysteine O-methyltransferase Ste14